MFINDHVGVEAITNKVETKSKQKTITSKMRAPKRETSRFPLQTHIQSIQASTSSISENGAKLKPKIDDDSIAVLKYKVKMNKYHTKRFLLTYIIKDIDLQAFTIFY